MRQLLALLKTYSRYLYMLGIFSMVIGLSLSKPLITGGILAVLLAWLTGESIKQRVLSYFNNRTAVVLSSIYLLTIFGLFYTTDFDFALGDVRRKLALFSLPVLIAGFSPITNNEWKWIFRVYVGGVLLASFWSMFVYFGGLGELIVDAREYSRFNSHIRFGLEICLAIFGSIYFLKHEKESLKKLIWLLISLWLISFLYIISLFTGLVIFGITTVVLILFIGLTFSNQWVRYAVLTAVIVLIGFVFTTVYQTVDTYKEQQNRVPLASSSFTSGGEKYFEELNNLRKTEKENGYYVWKHIAWKELEQEWNKRSDLLFSGNDLKGQDLSTTIIRYITSKGVYKDASGVKELSNKDVEAIEKGVSNYAYLSVNNVQKRITRILWEFEDYNNGRDFNGHSVVMRWEYWKTAYRIFKANKWFGVGTGDLQVAFDTQYEKDNSKLLPRYRLRAHNQYITYAVTFGVLGVICFGLFLIYPLFKNKMYNDFIYLAFFSIITLSMLAEDTLEPQVGVYFFALFNTILLLKAKKQPQEV